MFSNGMYSMGGSIPSGGRFQIATNLVSDAFDSLLIFMIVTQDSAQALYIVASYVVTSSEAKICQVPR